MKKSIRIFTIIVSVTAYILNAFSSSRRIFVLINWDFIRSMQKIAIVQNTSKVPFYVTTPSRSDTLVRGTLSAAKTWSYSNESVSIADFSNLKTPGSYLIIVPGVGFTIPFQVKSPCALNLAAGSLKGYYYQRASTVLAAPYAGVWARAIGHPDNNVQVHSSATTVTAAGRSNDLLPTGLVRCRRL